MLRSLDNGIFYNSNTNFGYTVGGGGQAWYVGYTNNGTTSTSGNHTHSVGNSATNTGVSAPGTSASGSGSAHNNMPPYLTVYMWKRTG